MGSRIPAPFRGAFTGLRKVAEAGTRTTRFWRDLSLLALILVLSVLLGLRAAGRLMRGRWALGFIGLAILISLAVFAFQPDRARRATADNPQAGQTASARPPQALEQEGKSDDEVVDAASIKERRTSGGEAPKEAKIERQPAADVDTVAGAIVTGKEAREKWRTEPPRQYVRQTEPPAQETWAEQPMQAAREQPEADATKETNLIADAPAGLTVESPESKTANPAGNALASKDGAGSTADLRQVKPEAAPFRAGETSWRRSLRGHHRHYQVVWSYLTHPTGVGRMGPVPVYVGR